MKYKTAHFFWTLFSVVVIILCMIIMQSFVLIFSLGAMTGIMSSEQTMGVSHSAVVDAAQFAAKMSIPIGIFFAIVGMIVAFTISDWMKSIIMKRVPEEEMPKKKTYATWRKKGYLK